MADNSKHNLNERLSEYEVLDKFKKLRQEQRLLLSELVNAEQYLDEMRAVVELLTDVDNSRPCFYNVDTVLLKSTPADILSVLLNEKNQVEKNVQKLNRDLTEKSKEIFDHQMSYNIRVNAKELTAPMRRFLGEF